MTFKRKELSINTDFFDDHLEGLQIPQAIKITHSVETQTFIKDGLNEDEDLIDPRFRASLIIEKIASRLLVDNFINAWQELKEMRQSQYVGYSDTSYQRQSPLIHARGAQQDRIYITEQSERKLSRQKLHLEKINNDFGGSAVQWLQKQEKNIRNRSKQAISQKYKASSKGAQYHFQRAKMLKEIVNKLKRGKQTVNHTIGEVEHIQEGYQLQQKLSRLERLVEDLHRSQMRRENIIYKTMHPQQVPKSNRGSEKSAQISQQMSKRINQEMLVIRKQMQLLRNQNLVVMRRQQLNKIEAERLEMERIADIKIKMSSQYDQVRRQIENLQRQKYIVELENWQTQKEIESHNVNKEQFERELGLLQKKVQELEIREKFHMQVKRQMATYSTHSFQRQHVMQPAPQASRPIIVPVQASPYGYSTFTTQRQSSNGLQQTKLEKVLLLPSQTDSRQQRPPLQWPQTSSPHDRQSCCC